MKKMYMAMLLVVTLGIAGGYYFFTNRTVGHKVTLKSGTVFTIKDFDYDRDHEDVERIFNQPDNRYWLLADGLYNNYSVDHMLKYRARYQDSYTSTLTLKVGFVDGKLVAFTAYYPESPRVGRLLFLLVDESVRRLGAARALLLYALDRMIQEGALKVMIYTRNNNFRAQNLYQSIGSVVTQHDDVGLFYTWYKPKK
ncbi:GNAT family N-acetyltransferase [Candidatus Babeliales bacterium]|nr:GNAT family N-acetyltransferase [Candidatus Babeliales bacterium]